MKLEIKSDSTNYTAQIIKLPHLQKVEGLDNLVRVSVQGNDCLVGKDTNVEELHIFFPSECKLSHDFLFANNLYRHSELNSNQALKGFFEDNGRVKSMKFKGVISTGFVIPVSSLAYLGKLDFKVGQEFTSIDGKEVCCKYYRKIPGMQSQKQPKLLDSIVDSRMAPEHFDTSHLLRNVSKLSLDDYVAVTYKLHGTSARYFHTLTTRPLSWWEKFAKFFGAKVETEQYSYVVGSRKVIKSVDFKTLDGKNHYYDADVWTATGQHKLRDRLNKGEAVYCEIIGKDWNAADIQQGYTYGLESPSVYVYRISNISAQGIEIDLPYLQMKERAVQLGLETCPELFYGKLYDFLRMNTNVWPHMIQDDRDKTELLEKVFYDKLLEQPSILDPSVIEEGFCIRADRYPRPEIFKIKAKAFLLHEGKMADQNQIDIEGEQSDFTVI